LNDARIHANTERKERDMDQHGGYLAGQTVSEGQMGQWVEQFHRDGFLLLPHVLPPEWVTELREDLDRAFEEQPHVSRGGFIDECTRMFEFSSANLRLFDMEPIVSFAEALINGPCHVFHNSAFCNTPGKGLTEWHQDDPPYYFVTHGEPPTNVHLPVLCFTCNYYLTDVPSEEYGPTQTIPGSHFFGATPPSTLEGTRWEEQIVSNLGPAGSVVMFSNLVWHRGGPNSSRRTRYIGQVGYAHRMIGHKYYPFMNYQMPEHVFADANPRLKRLLGFLPSGHYG
jgi:ectoine hydroxylase-related dioxygenase (phytanoyl-CoA dioxygenase family)